MNKEVKFLIGFAIVFALALLLVLQVSAAQPDWTHEFVELPDGSQGHQLVPRDSTEDRIEYDCDPYVTITGCNDAVPGKECYNGYFEPTYDLGIACGMTVYYWSPYPPFPPGAICHYEVGQPMECEFSINFEETVCPHGLTGIPGWRTGFTYSGNARLRGYLGTYMYSYTYWPWLSQISWRNGIIAPHRVDFSYDPETPTCAESGWGAC